MNNTKTLVLKQSFTEKIDQSGRGKTLGGKQNPVPDAQEDCSRAGRAGMAEGDFIQVHLLQQRQEVEGNLQDQ